MLGREGEGRNDVARQLFEQAWAERSDEYGMDERCQVEWLGAQQVASSNIRDRTEGFPMS